MLHTKFQSHRSVSSGEDFLRFLPHMGVAAMLVMPPISFEQLFVPKDMEVIFGYIWPSSFKGEVV